MADATGPRPEPSGRRITLGGLMVIMLVISLAAALLIPAFIAAKESSNRALCQGHWCHLYRGMHVYASVFGNRRDFMPHDGDAFFTCLLGHSSPEHPTSYATKAIFIGNTDLYVCHSTDSDETAVTPGGSIPDYLGPARHPQMPAGNPSALADGVYPGSPIGCDKPGNHRGGGNVLRFDGSVSFREDPDYTAAAKACSD